MESAPLFSFGFVQWQVIRDKRDLIGWERHDFFPFFGTVISPWKSRTFCYLDAFLPGP